MKFLWCLCLSLIMFACGEESDGGTSSTADGGMSGSPVGDHSCYISDECPQGTYCRATDPIMSAQGRCVPFEPAGSPCVYGTDCQTNLICKKPRGELRGVCQEFPPDCGQAPGCNCALTACDTMAGSSCSPTDPDNPADTITVYCAP